MLLAVLGGSWRQLAAVGGTLLDPWRATLAYWAA
nr:MAG TPA: hypothetical protein [Caudoviricetes sp.]